jgi:hypothetical protein
MALPDRLTDDELALRGFIKISDRRQSAVCGEARHDKIDNKQED